jgi:TatD DNase family protein
MIDTHSHLYAEEFLPDIDLVISRAKEVGVKKIYLPAIDSATHGAMIELAGKHAGYCIPMIGLHPCYVDENYERELEIVEEWLGKEKFAAIGEIGLDYYHSTDFKEQQIDAFRRQVQMALREDLPIVIHTRSSMDDCIKLVEQEGHGKVRGIFHCFGGDERQAKRIVELGFMLGIGGVVTYKNAGLVKVLETVPMEVLVLETDAPYLAPVPFRGKRNESAYIKYVSEKIAEIKGISEEEVSQITTENAKKIFRF